MSKQINGKGLEKPTTAKETTQITVQEVSCCKAMDKLRLLVLVKKLAKVDDANIAAGLIQAYFESEVGDTASNSIIVELSGGKYPLKKFVNTTNKASLYPQLARACFNEAARQNLKQIQQENVRHHVSRFLEQWQRTELQANTDTASTDESPIATAKPKGRRGRPITKPFVDVILTDEPSKTLATLHKLLDGCKGTKAAMVVSACIKGGIIIKPTYTQVVEEFGFIGNKSGYNKALREHTFTDDEINGILKNIK